MKKSITVMIGLGACLLAPALLNAQQQDDPLYTKRLVEARTRAKKEGLALTLAEIPKPKIPDADNAATYLIQLQALEKRKSVSREDADFIHNEWFRAKPTPQRTLRAKRILTSRADIMSLVEKTAACSSFYLPFRMTKVSATYSFAEFPFEAAAALRGIARWIHAKTLLLLAEGRYQEAVANQAKAFRLARISSRAQDTSQYLLSSALDVMAVRGMDVVLYEAGERAGVAEAALKALEREPFVMSWEPLLSFQLATFFDNMDAPRKAATNGKYDAEMEKSLPKEAQEEFKRYGYPKDPAQRAERYFNANETNLIRRVVELKSVMASPYYQKPPEGFPSAQEIERLSKEPDTNLAMMPLSTFYIIRTRAAKNEAERVVLQAGAQVLAWKVAHGEFPNALQEINPDVSLDPFDGKPIRYRKEGAGFIVYSVGESLKYDGGVRAEGKRIEGAFRYPAPPRKDFPPAPKSAHSLRGMSSGGRRE